MNVNARRRRLVIHRHLTLHTSAVESGVDTRPHRAHFDACGAMTTHRHSTPWWREHTEIASCVQAARGVISVTTSRDEGQFGAYAGVPPTAPPTHHARGCAGLVHGTSADSDSGTRVPGPASRTRTGRRVPVSVTEWRASAPPSGRGRRAPLRQYPVIRRDPIWTPKRHTSKTLRHSSEIGMREWNDSMRDCASHRLKPGSSTRPNSNGCAASVARSRECSRNSGDAARMHGPTSRQDLKLLGRI